MNRFCLVVVSFSFLGAGCPEGCSPTPVDAGVNGDAGNVLDGGAEASPDASSRFDGGAEPSPDAADMNGDAGAPGDAGAEPLNDAGAFDAGASSGVDAGADAGMMGGDADAGGSSDDGGTVSVDAGSGPLTFTAVTFNSGTTSGLAHDSDGDAYGDTQVQWSDDHYGNGLAWSAAIDAATAFFADVQPEIVAFQEIFHPEDCASIPANVTGGFVCSTWVAGDLTVAQRAVGAGYQVACNLGKPDKCLALKTSFGSIRGCNSDICLDGLDGAPVPDCGGGSRIGRATVDLARGGEMTVVTVHGTSGISGDDVDCRIAQVEQVFLDLDGDAQNGADPGANGARNLVLGDLNTDPKRSDLFDDSAHRWLQFVDDDEDFHFISDVGFFADPTYSGISNIDHVMSEVFVGSCTAPGITAGTQAIYPNVYFDHVPIVCAVSEPE